MNRHAGQSRTYRARLSQITLALVTLGLGILAYGVTHAKDRPNSNTAAVWQKIQGGHTDDVNSAIFVLDGRSVLTTSDDNTACLWDTATGLELRCLTGHTNKVMSVFVLGNHSVLTVSWDRTARLWDVITGKELRRFTVHDRPVKSVQLAPDGRTILIAHTEAQFVFLWDLATGRELRRFRDHVSEITSVAFAPDGRIILTASGLNIASDDGTVRLWDRVTGKELRRFTVHNGLVDSALFASDGRTILGSSGEIARLWDASTGRELLRFEGHTSSVNSAVFSPDGRTILTASSDGTARLWDRVAGRELRRFTVDSAYVSINSAVFSPDGRTILTASSDRIARLWDTATGRELRRFKGYIEQVASAAFAPDGRSILTASRDHTAHLWDTTTGKELPRFEGHTAPLYSAVFAPDGRRILTTSEDYTARLWDATTSRELHRFEDNLGNVRSAVFDNTGKVHSAVFSDDGNLILMSYLDIAVRLWDTTSGRELRRFEGHTASVLSAGFAPDGRSILTAGSDADARLWDTATGDELRRFEGHTGEVYSAVFARDSRTVLTASWDHTARLWDAATGRELRRFNGHSGPVYSAVFARDSRTVLTASWDHTARLWDAATGRELRRFNGHTKPVTSAAFAPNSQTVLTASWDGTTRLWDLRTGKEIVRLMSFTDGTWVVATPDGRFDTNNLEEIKGLHWLVPDDPLHALPVEIFMRDYYEPRLLPRVLAGEKLPDIRSLADLNRAQPTVQIVHIERESESGASTNNVSVTVAVSGASQEFGLKGQKRWMETGAYDLRLFRDGQLVGQWPSVSEHSTTVGLNAADELQRWRKERLVVKLKDGTRQLVFKGIRLPQREGLKEVQFSAYVFNEDRVKSETSRRPFNLPTDLTPRIPRAYIISVGVNAFEDPRWDLSYAVNDATYLGAVLTTRLQAQRNEQGQPPYEDVVWVKLTAEAQTDKEGKRHLTKTQASKAQIAAVLQTLAGQSINTEVLKGIANVDYLRRANPEDLVIFALSTHGEVDQRGQFYLLPYDIGINSTGQQRRERAISNDDLSAWLQGLDAIDLVMIVDACHSAASVQTAEFKPGPMGSRGLGQLAYDKGMRILTATQIDQYALETQKTQLGLLSYALVREGLEQANADYKPKDQQIWLSEWLSYASERVPELYTDWKAGTLKGRKKGEFLDAPEAYPGETPALQQPALFDFARNRDVQIGSAR